MDGYIYVLLAIGALFVVIVVGRYLKKLPKLHEDAESDDIEVRREALYQLGNNAWERSTRESNTMTPADRERRKNEAVEYWIQAAKLGHEGAADKLLMAQIRR